MAFGFSKRQVKKRRVVKTVIVNPTEQIISNVGFKDDASTSSDDSSIFVRDEHPPAPAKSCHHVTNLVPASLQDIGRIHSRIDVHGCLGGTSCNHCGPSDSISFIPRESSNVELLQKTMWAICGAEQESMVPTINMCGVAKSSKRNKSFRCTCGREACGNFYEI